MLMSNFFAQTEALAFGLDAQTVSAELEASGKTAQEILDLTPHKVFEGNKPTNSILIRKMTPYNLGALVALYEHKVFVQGVLWQINSFDQWGVELGKKLAKVILPELQDANHSADHDNSTLQLIEKYHQMRRD